MNFGNVPLFVAVALYCAYVSTLPESRHTRRDKGTYQNLLHVSVSYKSTFCHGLFSIIDSGHTLIATHPIPSPPLTCSMVLPSPPHPSHVVCHVVFLHGVLVKAVRNVLQFFLLQTTNEAVCLHVSHGREEGREKEEREGVRGGRREGGRIEGRETQ